MTLATRTRDLISIGQSWLKEQLNQAEQLRPILAGAVVILFVVLIVTMIGIANDRTRNLHTAQIDLARLKQQVKEGSWTERKQQSETRKFQLRDRFWTAETAGLAEASLERWLRERVEALGARPDSIRIQRAAVGGNVDSNARNSLAGVQRMTAKLIMPFEPEALFDVLRSASTHDKFLVVDRLLIRSGRNALVEMDISTFVVLPEGGR